MTSDDNKTPIIICVICLVGIFIIAFCISMYKDMQKDEYIQEAKELYNNGIHTNCGGHLIYQESVDLERRYIYQNYYVFRCDKCGKIIKLEEEIVKGEYVYTESPTDNESPEN